MFGVVCSFLAAGIVNHFIKQLLKTLYKSTRWALFIFSHYCNTTRRTANKTISKGLRNVVSGSSFTILKDASRSFVCIQFSLIVPGNNSNSRFNPLPNCSPPFITPPLLNTLYKKAREIERWLIHSVYSYWATFHKWSLGKWDTISQSVSQSSIDW